MEAPDSLQIDLANPSDIKEKLPKAETILSQMEDDLRRQQREIDRWRNLVEVLRSVADANAGGVSVPAEPSPTPAEQAPDQESLSPVQDLVVEVVNREIREIRSRDIRDILLQEGHSLNSESVSNSLWNAAEKAQKIQRIRRGWYAPLDYVRPNENPFEDDNPFSAAPNGASNGDEGGQKLEPAGRIAPAGERTGRTPGGSV
jgi:hypothetical protein